MAVVTAGFATAVVVEGVTPDVDGRLSSVSVGFGLRFALGFGNGCGVEEEDDDAVDEDATADVVDDSLGAVGRGPPSEVFCGSLPAATESSFAGSLPSCGGVWGEEVVLAGDVEPDAGSATLLGDTGVSGSATLLGETGVSGKGTLLGDTGLSGNATLLGDTGESGNATLLGETGVRGNGTLLGDTGVSGNGTWLGETVCGCTGGMLVSSLSAGRVGAGLPDDSAVVVACCEGNVGKEFDRRGGAPAPSDDGPAGRAASPGNCVAAPPPCPPVDVDTGVFGGALGVVSIGDGTARLLTLDNMVAFLCRRGLPATSRGHVGRHAGAPSSSGSEGITVGLRAPPDISGGESVAGDAKRRALPPFEGQRGDIKRSCAPIWREQLHAIASVLPK
ncbi:hypothetical protein [Mitsuaria sp. 7]|uniref:hypothetical protein n=1 Tax=Mitsuaria sp. 7 TaxID=1658665 RepID=UPI0012FB6E7C|nr:hypothetical protein [Mitsuaria sp. 7]